MIEFIEAIDTNKDGEISFDEFRLFLQFHSGAFGNLEEVLLASAKALAVLKHVAQAKEAHTVDENSTVRLLLQDKGVDDPTQLPTVVALLAGDLKNHPELAAALGAEVPQQSALVFSFKVQNRALVLENFPQYCEAIRAVLAELGPDAQSISQSLEFAFRETPDGVQMIVDLQKVPAAVPLVLSAEGVLA